MSSADSDTKPAIAIQSYGSVSEHAKNQPDSGAFITVDPEQTAFLRVLSPLTGHDHKVPRPARVYTL